MSNLFHEGHNVPQNVPQNVSQNVPQSHTLSIEDYIFVLIQNNPKITRKEIASIIGKNVKTIQRIINKMKNIKYVGSAKNGYWKILD